MNEYATLQQASAPLSTDAQPIVFSINGSGLGVTLLIGQEANQ